jgi:MYXO-CTERM domain-containing protein
VVYRSSRSGPRNERALVLQALGIEHGMVAVGGEFLLLVAARDARAAVEQLRRFEAENAATAAPDDRLAIRRGFRAGALLWSLTLVALYAAEHLGALGLPWWSVGAAQAERIRSGELWRAVTALGLHVDVPHLAGNLVFGALFLGVACQAVGLGGGLLLTLLAGSLGNLLAALVRDAAGTSVGASTAVFGALGLLAALQWRRRRRRQASSLRRWTPVVAAALLLAYLGTAGAQVDILAHATGFACGLGLGVAIEPRLERRLAGPGAQLAQGLLAAAIVAAAWVWGFTPA